MAELSVDIVAADHIIWSGKASMVSASAIDGEVGILPGHAPLLAVLGAGSVRVQPVSGAKIVAPVTGGFLSVDADTVTIVVDTTEPSIVTRGQ